MNLFKLRGDLSNRQRLFLSIGGFVFLILMWAILARAFAYVEPIYDSPLPKDYSSVSDEELDDLLKQDELLKEAATEDTLIYSYLRPPHKIVASYKKLYQSKNDDLLGNTWQSVWLNIQGYALAILISIPLGFLIGLLPLFKGLFNQPVNAIRYLPLTALTGMFFFIFKSPDNMKIAFLAIGITVYLLPVVVQRITEVADIHLKTVFTLGAKPWETIRSVYLPSVFSKLSDDIRVLTAISWTYIIVAELAQNKGGIGAMIFFKGKTGYLDEVFALLILIIVIGIIQDKIFLYLDRVLFPHKHFKQQSSLLRKGLEYARYGVVLLIIGLIISQYAGGNFGRFGYMIMLIGVGCGVFGELQMRKATA